MKSKNRSSKSTAQSIVVFMLLLSLMLLSACATISSDWEKAKEYNTLQSYQDFISKYPRTQLAADAESAIDRIKWLETEREDSEAAYRSYLQEFPWGRYASTAKEKLDRMKWQETERVDSEAAYKSYVQEFPLGIHVLTAYKKIDGIKWQETQREDSEEAYKNYLKDFPQGLHAATAKGKLEVIAWEKAQKNDSVKGYRSFTESFPSSKHSAAAESRIKKLLKDALLSDKEVRRLIEEITELISPFTLMEIWEECLGINYQNKSSAIVSTKTSSNTAKGEASSVTFVSGSFIAVKARLKPNSNLLTSTVIVATKDTDVGVAHYLGKVGLSASGLDMDKSKRKLVAWFENPLPGNQELSFEKVFINPDKPNERIYQKIGDSWYKTK